MENGSVFGSFEPQDQDLFQNLWQLDVERVEQK